MSRIQLVISFILFAVARTMNNHYLERVKFSKTIELTYKGSCCKFAVFLLTLSQSCIKSGCHEGVEGNEELGHPLTENVCFIVNIGYYLQLLPPRMRELLEWQSASIARVLFSLPLREPVRFFMRCFRKSISCTIGAATTP